MRILVPLISWLICIPFSFFFLFAWGMSAFGPPHSFLRASSYLCVAVPVLAIGAILLLLQFKRRTWLSFAIHVLPWNAFPWLASVFFVSSGDRGPWIELAELLGLPSLVCCGLVTFFQQWPLLLPKPVQCGLRILGAAAIGAIIVGWWCLYRADCESHRRSAEQTRLREKEFFERLTPVPPGPIQKPLTEAEWRSLWAIPVYDTANGRLTGLTFSWLGESVSPLAMEAIKHVESLRSLRLEGPWVKDSDLQFIKHLKGLKHLALIDTSITDAGVREIAHLNGLEILSLVGSPVTDKSLGTFREFPRLRLVSIFRTKITAGGRRSFVGALNQTGQQIALADY